MISGNTDKWIFEHGMTTRRRGRHDIWKCRQMDIRTWNDYKTMGKTWSLEIQINEHSSMFECLFVCISRDHVFHIVLWSFHVRMSICLLFPEIMSSTSSCNHSMFECPQRSCISPSSCSHSMFRHDLWKYRQIDIRTWNDYKTMGETWSLEIQTNRHLNMEWLYIYTRRCGRHDLCGHSNMEWLQARDHVFHIVL
jgi:hypothetical protein